MPIIHLLANALLILLAGIAGWSILRIPRGRAIAAAVSLAVLLLAFWLPLRPDIFSAALPFSGIVFYENLYPLGVALFFPLALRFGKSRFHHIRIAILLCILLAAAMKPMLGFWRPPAETGRGFIDEHGVCRQTSPDSCSAAAAVTLLSLRGVKTTEEEVARLAFTKIGAGTTALGQYRALRILAAKSETPLKVGIMRRGVDDLLKANQPVIITVGLRKDFNPEKATQAQRDLVDLYQWRPGVMHDVVLLGGVPGDPDHIRIGEPDFGLETWLTTQLRDLYQGFAVTVQPAD